MNRTAFNCTLLWMGIIVGTAGIATAIFYICNHMGGEQDICAVIAIIGSIGGEVVIFFLGFLILLLLLCLKLAYEEARNDLIEC